MQSANVNVSLRKFLTTCQKNDRFKSTLTWDFNTYLIYMFGILSLKRNKDIVWEKGIVQINVYIEQCFEKEWFTWTSALPSNYCFITKRKVNKHELSRTENIKTKRKFRKRRNFNLRSFVQFLFDNRSMAVNMKGKIKESELPPPPPGMRFKKKGFFQYLMHRKWSILKASAICSLVLCAIPISFKVKQIYIRSVYLEGDYLAQSTKRSSTTDIHSEDEGHQIRSKPFSKE